MEILITKQCESITGSLGRGYGYHIQRRKNGFFAKRNSNGAIPADGHLRFIFACAELARLKTHIADIRVSRKELREALSEAGYSHHLASRCPVLASSASECPVPRCPVLASSASECPESEYPELLSAADIINFRRDYLPNPA